MTGMWTYPAGSIRGTWNRPECHLQALATIPRLCYCQKKQTEHSIRPVSSAIFSYRYDSFKADRIQTLRAHWSICSYVFHSICSRCVPLTATHCHLRLTWSREHAL
ncbi:hypothetical protein TNCV_1301601 [Trichonephila clavipes]|nr:hypothetical protein TNCV_1301601 [Trichonephila clavipes]